MPMIEVTYPSGALTEQARTGLPADLAAVLLRAEKAPDTTFVRSITWTYLHEMPDKSMFVGGESASEATFRLDVTVPRGALSPRRKALLVEEATTTILHAAGLDTHAAANVWVIIHEFPDGNFGRAGRTYGLEDLIRFAHEGDTQPTTGPASQMTASSDLQ